MDQEGNQKKNDDSNKVVTSVGNSWVVCRSKSYSGHVYYFNTLSGEAVWNLSDTEIEKAKRRTRSLRNCEEVLESCPEPKEPPMEQGGNQKRNYMDQNSTPSKIYNKQIINNQFTKQSYPISPFVAQCNHLMPACGTLNSLASIGYACPTASYNTNLWAVPPAPQIFIASPPLVGHDQTSPNATFNNPNPIFFVHKPTIPLSTRFQMQKEKKNSPPKKHVPNNKFGHQREKHIQKRFHRNYNTSNNDLRQFISYKRTRRNTAQSRSEDINDDNGDDDNLTNIQEEESQFNIRQNKHTDEGHEDHYQSDADNDWLEENISFKGTKLHLDVTNLKKLAKADAKAECWYIAVDTTILTCHLNFLNILINSDDLCHLMVPKKVLDDLRLTAETSRNMPRLRKRSRRAVDFLTQLLEAGSAKIGDAMEKDDKSDYMINCCLNLAQLNYHVILLSNETELQNYKTSTPTPIFSIKELKQFLSEGEDRESSPEPHPQPPERPIKITIPNDFPNVSNESLLTNDINSDIDVSNREISTTQQFDKCNEINVHANEIVLKSLDKQPTYVQTETETVRRLVEPIVPSENNETNTKKTVNDIQERILTLTLPVETNNQVNKSKRQIRLKRSKPQISVGIEHAVEKKQFKWRRRRDGSNTQTNESRLYPNSNSESGPPSACVPSPKELLNTDASVSTESKRKVTDQSQMANQVSHEFFSRKNDNSKITVESQIGNQVSYESMSQESNNTGENIEGSETSSCVYIHRNIGEITIEETSTSIISNTSHGNSECSSIPKIQLITNKNTSQKDGTLIKNHMYEVTNKAMEDYLKMRCDEWISRFVQIMEEVLGQVLRQDPLFLKTMIPPPWTLYEATQCINMMFNKDSNIIDAARKLSNLLLQISDDKGKINMNLRPSEFMEMYSYGAYLVNVLQAAVDNCEDIQTAAENLSTLLNDIQNPNLDCSHNETFDDHTDEIAAPSNQVTGLNESIQSNEIIWGYRKGQVDNDLSGTATKQYNLRSKKRKNEEETNKEQPIKSIRQTDVESKFFTSLHLKRKAVKENELNKSCGQLSFYKNKELSPKPRTISQNADTTENTDKASTEAKFIRQFSTCPQFESRLTESCRESTDCVEKRPVDLDELDYSDHYNDYCDDYMNEDYCSDQDYNYNQENVTDIEESNVCAREEETLHPDVKVDDNNNVVILFLKNFIKDIKESFTQVHRLCIQCRHEMNFELTQSRKMEIHEKAENAHVIIDSLCKSLNSLFTRESSEHENNIQSLLKKAGVDNLDLSDSDLVAYRDNVANCIDTAKSLLEMLKVTISVVKHD